MITALRIIKEDNKSMISRIRSLVFPYSIETETLRLNNISVFNIRYHRRRGNVRFDKIYEKCIGHSKVILCDKSVNLFNTPFRRFESTLLNRSLMKNYIVKLLTLSNIPPKDLTVSYYDPDAGNPSFISELLRFTSKLTVVTDMPKFYEKEAARISDSSGAAVLISNNLSDLIPCDILIAPDVIRKNIPSYESSLIFTCAEPTVSLCGNIIYTYPSDFPQEITELCPEGIDIGCFLSAVFILYKQKQLGKLIPHSCGDKYNVYSDEIMLRKLKASCMFSPQ